MAQKPKKRITRVSKEAWSVYEERKENPLLEFDAIKKMLSDEHPDWTEDQLLTQSTRIILFDEAERAAHENSDKRFYNHADMIGLDPDYPDKPDDDFEPITEK